MRSVALTIVLAAALALPSCTTLEPVEAPAEEGGGGRNILRGLGNDLRALFLLVERQSVKFTAILVALFLCGCAGQAQQPDYGGFRPDGIPAGHARIVLFRTRDSILYVARKAAISIDGEKVGGTGYGTYRFHDVGVGQPAIRADMWDMPGECELTLNAAVGRTYYFQVDPRAESFGAFAAGDVTGWLLSENVWVGLAGGVGAIALESYGQECGGAFRLYPVDAPTAEARIDSLRLSR